MRLFVPKVLFWGCYFNALVDPRLLRLLISSWFWIGKSQISKYLSLLNTFSKFISSYLLRNLFVEIHVLLNWFLCGRKEALRLLILPLFSCHPTLLYVWYSIVSLLLSGLCHWSSFLLLYNNKFRHIVLLIF